VLKPESDSTKSNTTAFTEIYPKHYPTNANTQLQMATTINGKLNQADILLNFLFPRS